MIKEDYGDAAMGRSDVFEWHKLFRDGRERVEDDDHSGRTSTNKTNQKVSRGKRLLNSDRRMSIRMIADELSIPQTIVTQSLAMRKVCTKFVPRVLSQEQNANRKAICQDLLLRVNEDFKFLDNVVTDDQTWVFEFDLESKRLGSECDTPLLLHAPRKHK
ncbi:protein GVQW3 [Trichonephila clavipes]|nr:protein GVQW3 [Trichonephila clavipes]